MLSTESGAYEPYSMLSGSQPGGYALIARPSNLPCLVVAIKAASDVEAVAGVEAVPEHKVVALAVGDDLWIALEQRGVADLKLRSKGLAISAEPASEDSSNGIACR